MAVELTGLTAELHTGRAGLADLSPHWRALAATLPSAGFHHTDLAFRLREELTLSQAPLHVIEVKASGGYTVALIPLQRRKARIRRLEFTAWDLPTDFDRPATDIICADSGVATAILPALAGCLLQADPIARLLAFPRVEASSALGTLIAAAPPARRSLVPNGHVFRIPTNQPLAKLLDATSRKFRSNLRRGWRNLAALGEVYHQVAETPEAVAIALERFLDLEACGWKGQEPDGNAIRRHPGVLAYTRAWLVGAAAESACEVHSLMTGARCVAAIIALRGPTEIYVFKVAYDETLAQTSPAHLLLERCLEGWCANPAIRACNGGPETAWFRPWRPLASPTFSAYVSLGGIKPRLALSLLRLPTRHALFNRSSRKSLP